MEGDPCGGRPAEGRVHELAIENGFNGTQTEWLDSLVGKQGDPGPGGKSSFQLALDEGFEGNVDDWLRSLIGPKGEHGIQGDKGEDGRGIEIRAYYESLDEFLNVHEFGNDGDCYGVVGSLYVWAGDRWSNAGKLIGASAFEIWLEQPGNFGKSFDDFFDELAARAFSEAELAALVQSKVAAWLTHNAVSVLPPLINDWLDRNLESLLPALMENTLQTHVTEYHAWQTMEVVES